MPQYAGKTSLILLCDTARRSFVLDWVDHSKKSPAERSG